jgi:hypothetical protein
VQPEFVRHLEDYEAVNGEIQVYVLLLVFDPSKKATCVAFLLGFTTAWESLVEA